MQDADLNNDPDNPGASEAIGSFVQEDWAQLMLFFCQKCRMPT